jgi:prepilin-type N-terminal cleavage/methylation domain-containing protein
MRAFSPVLRAFTLVEMLAVMAIIVILLALVVPAFLGDAASVDKSIYDIQGALQAARTYAVASHSYTWVGVFEEDVSQPGATPAIAGIGRVVICIVASKDGTSIYNLATAANGTPQMLPSARLLEIGKLIKLNNIHIFTPPSSTDTFGQRPGDYLTAPGNRDRVGLSSNPPLFSFQYPLGGTAQYIFGHPLQTGSNGVPVANGIVQFDPQGEVTSDAGPVPGVAPCKEIAIQATHGTAPDNGVNAAAVDLGGLTGEATIYRR